MTTLLGDTGKCVSGSLKTLNCTAWGTEATVTAQALPSAKPASPQWSFTVNKATMQPTITGDIPSSWDIVGGFGISGQNNSGASQTISYQINKNGASYKTGSVSTSNTNYYTLAIAEGLPLVDGTIYDFYVWCPSASVNYFYNFAWAIPTRIELGAGKTIANISVTLIQPVNGSNTGSVVVGSGSPTSPWTGSLYGYPVLNNSSNSLVVPTNVATIGVLNSNSTYKHFSAQTDAGGAQWGLNTATTYYPRAQQNYYPSKITWRELPIVLR